MSNFDDRREIQVLCEEIHAAGQPQGFVICEGALQPQDIPTLQLNLMGEGETLAHFFYISRGLMRGGFYLFDGTDHIQEEFPEVYGPHATAKAAWEAFLTWWEKYSYTLIGLTQAELYGDQGGNDDEVP